MMEEEEDRQEVDRLLKALSALLRILEIPKREVERRLGLHPNSLTRLFNGQVEAKLWLILGMVRAIGLEYEEFFNFAYPGRLHRESESPAAQSIRDRLSSLQGPRPRLQREPDPSERASGAL